MFDIISVDLTNFKSFTGTHVFEMPGESGLYYLTGKNNVEPSLGANGAGKSTLLDAIYWCLYGKTSRGLKAGDVISWGQKSCSVTVHLSIDDEALIVNRAQSPNCLTLNGAPIDQQELQKHLRLGPDAFLYAVMIPQFGDHFLDLSPANALTLLSQILELDYWLERSKAAHALAENISQDTARCERECAECRGKIDAIKTTISQAQEQEKAFEEIQAKAIALHRKKAQELQVDIKFLGKCTESGARALAGAVLRLKKYEGVATKKAVAEHDLSTAVSNLKRLNSLGPSCPTCLQLVDQGYIASEQSRFQKEIGGLEEVIKYLDIQLQDQRQIERNKRDFESELVTEQRKLALLKERHTEIAKQCKNEQERHNPCAEIIAKGHEQVEQLSLDLKNLKHEESRLRQDHTAISFWINGFKRVRLFIVEDTLRQLEVEVNSNLASLGLTDWRIEFDVERENKSGGVTKGFTTLVHAPGHDQPVKYEAWSGGELQRLRLATDLGLASLIMDRAGLTNSIEFYDEPSAHLSEDGLLDLAETLTQRATQKNSRIILVDHRLIDYAFTNTFLVVKDTGGSRLARG